MTVVGVRGLCFQNKRMTLERGMEGVEEKSLVCEVEDGRGCHIGGTRELLHWTWCIYRGILRNKVPTP